MRPIMIAVGGDSGTGKTTLCRGLERIFGADRIQSICLDDYHSLDRAQRKAVNLTALDPRANNFAGMEEDIWTLRDGQSIMKPVYDHHDGTFAEKELIEPREIIVVQGLFPLYTRTLRSLFDVSVWLAPQPELKLAWKIRRDVNQRGYTEAQVLEEIEKRRPDVEAHIEPQAAHADLIVEFSQPANYNSVSGAHLDARIYRSGRVDPLDLSEFEGSKSFRYIPASESPTGHTVLELRGDCDDETARALTDKIWSLTPLRPDRKPDGLGEFDGPNGPRVSHTLALAQLLIARRVAVAEQALLQAV